MSQLTCALTGTTLHNRQEIIRTLKIGERLTLHREPENPYDPNVLRVESAQGIVGYLPQEIAAALSPQMDSKGLQNLTAAAIQLQMEDELITVSVSIDLPDGIEVAQAPQPAPEEPEKSAPVEIPLPEEKTPVMTPDIHQEVMRHSRPTFPPAPQPKEEPKNNGCIIFLLVLLVIFVGSLAAVSIAHNSGIQIPLLNTFFPSAIPPTSTRTPRPTVSLGTPATPKPSATIVSDEVKTLQAHFSLTAQSATETAQAANSSSNSDCRSWESVTLADVGKEFCVQGVVVKAWFDHAQNAFFMSFGGDPGDLYMVVYNGWYYENVENYCVQFEGEVMQLGNSPVFVVNPQPGNLLYCH